MGEDKSKSSEVSHCRRSSVMSSSCSEDAESTSTSAGFPDDPEERDEELEYGPGIVNKLRTRFLSITLMQNRGSNMRRSCSMENLLDQGRPTPSPKPIEKTSIPTKVQNWGHLKRAKSMDTLLMEMNPIKDCDTEDKKQPKIIKRLDGGLTRPVVSICDEELPKPDTVRTYKRMFEPADSRRGSYCRRPPVLRASAKFSAGTKMNGTPPINISAKLNGSTSLKSRISAKQQSSSVQKAQTDLITSPFKKSGDQTKPLFNESHVVKATPVKISPHRNCKNNCAADVEKSLNSLNRFISKKDLNVSPKPEIVCNGNGNLKDKSSIKTTEEVVKQFSKNINGCANKPKVPPNRPSLKYPKPFPKIEEHISSVKTPSKLKSCFVNGIKKPDNETKSDICMSPQRVKSPDGNTVIVENRINGEFKKLCEFRPTRTSSPDCKPTDVLKSTTSNLDTIYAENDNILNKTIELLTENGNANFKESEEPKPISKELLFSETANPETKSPFSVPEKKVVQNGIVPKDRQKSPSSFSIPVKKSISNRIAPGDHQKSPATPLQISTKKNIPNGFVSEASPKLKLVLKSTLNGSASEDQPKSPSTPPTNPVTKRLSNGLVHEDRPKSASPPCIPLRKPLQNGFPFEDQVKPASPPIIPFRKTIPNGTSSEEPSKPASPPVLIKKTTENDSERSPKSPAPSPDVHNKQPIKKSPVATTSMVFDFRGKDVVSHVAVVPAPFGCKDIIQKRSEGPTPDEEDEDSVDYSVPQPCGLVFEGENIKVGRGSILSKRNKDLKLSFDEDVDNNTFVYPSETSLLEDPDKSQSTTVSEVIPNGQPPPQPSTKLKSNTIVGSGGGLSSYTPSVLRTVDNFEPGMFRPPPPEKIEAELKNQEDDEEDENLLLKPAEPHLISSWSISAGTSDLLF